MNSEVVEPEGLLDQLRTLKSVNVDGVMVDCWWGIVESHTPQVYNWSGYKKLFDMIRHLGLKLQVISSFFSYKYFSEMICRFHMFFLTCSGCYVVPRVWRQCWR